MKCRRVRFMDCGDVRMLRLLGEPTADGSAIRVRVTYLGEAGGAAPREDVTVRHRRDAVYIVPSDEGISVALERGFKMWRDDVR